jgi:hypothetical protein
MTTLFARSGQINGYSVFIIDDHISVLAPDGRALFHPVPNYGASIDALAAWPGFRTGWAQFRDGAEVLYFYDRDDAGFGYALNVTNPDCSEWGYCPWS